MQRRFSAPNHPGSIPTQTECVKRVHTTELGFIGIVNGEALFGDALTPFLSLLNAISPDNTYIMSP